MRRPRAASSAVTGELQGGLELLISTSPPASGATEHRDFILGQPATHPGGQVGGRSAPQTDELGRARMSGEPGLGALHANTSPRPSKRSCATAVCFHLAARWKMCQRSSRGNPQAHWSTPPLHNRIPTLTPQHNGFFFGRQQSKEMKNPTYLFLHLYVKSALSHPLLHLVVVNILHFASDLQKKQHF